MTGIGWMADAACADMAHLPWIGPTYGHFLDPADTERMQAICDDCPVRAACEQYVQTGEVTAGFWAGAWRTPDHTAGGRVA